MGLLGENENLRKENSKTRMGLMRSESERSELEKKLKLKDSQFGSTFRSDRSFEESRLEMSGGGLSRSRYDREHFKRSLNEANVASSILREKVEHLGREYTEILPRNPYKS